jgi:periplasmic protein TonB
MATCDHPSDLLHRIPPSSERPVLRIDSRVSTLRVEKVKRYPVPPRLQGIEAGEVFHSLVATGNFQPRSRWSTVGAIAFELLLVVAAIAIPLFNTDPLPKIERVTPLYLPPLAAGSNVPKVQAPKPRSTYSPSSLAIHVPVKSQETPRSSDVTTGAVVGGVPGGVVGGIPGAIFNGDSVAIGSMPVLAKAPPPAPVKRVRLAARVAEANLIHDVPPQYPAEAGRERIEGAVVLMAVIGKDGSVRDVRVESGLPVLAQAAIDAVKQWRYKPYMINGEPVEVDSRITINFTLSAS